jgi:hypothetical protein
MSLYIYVVPAPEEQADAYDAYVQRSPWSRQDPPRDLPPLHENSLCLGRPMVNDGAAMAENWYGKQVLGENDFTEALVEICEKYTGTNEGPDQEWFKWLVSNNGKTVIVGNDNEW